MANGKEVPYERIEELVKRVVVGGPEGREQLEQEVREVLQEAAKRRIINTNDGQRHEG